MGGGCSCLRTPCWFRGRPNIPLHAAICHPLTHRAFGRSTAAPGCSDRISTPTGSSGARIDQGSGPLGTAGPGLEVRNWYLGARPHPIARGRGRRDCGMARSMHRSARLKSDPSAIFRTDAEFFNQLGRRLDVRASFRPSHRRLMRAASRVAASLASELAQPHGVILHECLARSMVGHRLLAVATARSSSPRQ